jgi:hypothetical protein
MKIRCKVCGEFFIPNIESEELVSEGYIDPVDTCDDCWYLLNHLNDDTEEMISDADPGL